MLRPTLIRCPDLESKMRKLMIMALLSLACRIQAQRLFHPSAPHGGCLVEVGDEVAHLELVLDASSGKLTAYVLDGEAEDSVRIKQKTLQFLMQITGVPAFHLLLIAKSDPLTGETEGDSSQFEIRSARLKGLKAFSGRIGPLRVFGQTFNAVKFKYALDRGI
jgi:hypothetical protein